MKAGPHALREVSSGLRKGTINRIIRFCRANRVILRTGWKQTPNGILPPPIMEQAQLIARPWDLNKTGDGKVTVTAGTVRKGTAMDDELTVVGIASEFTPAANQFLYLRITPTTAHLECDGEWDEYPERWEISVGGDFENFYFPLWQFVATRPEGVPGVQAVGQDVYAVRLWWGGSLDVVQGLATDGSGNAVSVYQLVESNRCAIATE